MAVPADAGGLEHFSLAGALARIASSRQKATDPQGNESWLSVLKLQLAPPEGLLDRGAVPAGLSYVRMVGDELRIGALTRRADLLDSSLIREHFAVIREITEAAFRGLSGCGTIGAALCRPESSGRLVKALAAAGASVAIRGQRGIRLVSARSLRAGPAGPQIEAGELPWEIRLPIRPRPAH